MTVQYPKRLIEVDLPIREISAHSRREKSIRHGHISTLHIWWARRPLAACRAVICASLWPDPCDEICSQAFRDAAAEVLYSFAEKARSDKRVAELVHSHWKRWNGLKRGDWSTDDPSSLEDIRRALLDFIADFANWDASTVPAFLETARALTQSAHEALGGLPGTRPLLVDPFAGGGSIPLEALRVGADAFASDLNPVAVLLNKVVLEYIPKYGLRLADEVRKWGTWIKEQAEKELAEFYPKDPDGATPIAHLWARTIRCEGPGCGAEVPLIRSLWLAKKAKRSVALKIVPKPEEKRVDFEIIHDPKAKDVGFGTVARGSATCPCCGYTIPVSSVRNQLKERRGGTDDARMVCVVTIKHGVRGRSYRLPSNCDINAFRSAKIRLDKLNNANNDLLTLLPVEAISLNEIRRISVPLYGMLTWSDLFTPRQSLALITLIQKMKESRPEEALAIAVRTCLALAIDRQADNLSSLVTWVAGGEFQSHTFTRQALPMVWDFVEISLCADSTGGFSGAIEWISKVLERESEDNALDKSNRSLGLVECASATMQPLPDDSAQVMLTDPPYYDSVPYAYLSDYFYVWLKRLLYDIHQNLFCDELAPKDQEIVVDRPHELSKSTKGVEFYELELTKAFSESRRVVQPQGIGTIVFASKSTSSWEAILQSVIRSGWIITGSWPIDTERETRIAAQGQARLASSIHLVCRPRENPDGSLREDDIGNWREVLAELPFRIHAWMPRLAKEGIVGADAIFACLGPALEIFSRYSRVEKASGEVVTLKEYLENVWAAVSREALSMIFTDVDASGFEEDARLTAMWLWTLSTGSNGHTSADAQDDENEDDADEEAPASRGKTSGFILEFDAARKIAQGLGAHLEGLTTLVEIKGSTARLLPLSERSRYLFGSDQVQAPKKAKKPKQMSLLSETDDTEGQSSELGSLKVGETSLDRVHQSMILFGAGRTEALKRFLVEDGVGRDARFWKLAQAMSALYPTGTEEKRWVDGVLARKKGLGFG